jgi:hypothetical protein
MTVLGGHVITELDELARSEVAGRRYASIVGRCGRHESKPTSTQFSRRNTHDVEPVAVLYFDFLTRFPREPYNAVEEHLIGHIHPGVVDPPGGRPRRTRSVGFEALIGAVELGHLGDLGRAS